jgi:transcriptional regulator with XRE-family HTH domain
LNLTEIFAKNVLYYRTLANKSQEELGFDSDIHRTDIGRIERAEISTSIRNIEKLAKALGVPPYKLLITPE